MDEVSGQYIKGLDQSAHFAFLNSWQDDKVNLSALNIARVKIYIKTHTICQPKKLCVLWVKNSLGYSNHEFNT